MGFLSLLEEHLAERENHGMGGAEHTRPMRVEVHCKQGPGLSLLQGLSIYTTNKRHRYNHPSNIDRRKRRLGGFE